MKAQPPGKIQIDPMKLAGFRLAGFLVGMMMYAVAATGQNNQPITISLNQQITWAGVDRAGDLFVVLINGDVVKLNKEGMKLGTYSFGKPPALFEPMDGAQSFFFSSDQKHYGFLSTDMSSAKVNDMDPSFAITPWLVTPSLHELWILDAADLSLKKTKLNSMTISLESALKHLPDKKTADYTYMREYQNYLFLLDQQSGVHMFNSLGKYIRTMGTKNMDYFNFLGEEMYYVTGDHLTFVDLYSQEQRNITLPKPCRFALVNDDRLYAVGVNQVIIVPFKVE